MGRAFLLFLLSVIIRDPTVKDDADLVEVNHCYDGGAALVFEQIIYWDLYRDIHIVVDWHMLKTRSQVPFTDYRLGGSVQRFWKDGKMREVRAMGFTETWTQFDPELRNRKVVPMDQRRGIIRQKVK